MKDVYDLSEGNFPFLEITSKAFIDGENIPSIYTCDGGNHFPSINVSGIPREVETLILIIDDPDAPKKTFVHLIAWNILVSGDNAIINENILLDSKIGINDYRDSSWGLPCPPKGDGIHHYHFKVFGINSYLELPDNITKYELLKQIDLDDNLVAYGELIGEYER